MSVCNKSRVFRGKSQVSSRDLWYATWSRIDRFMTTRAAAFITRCRGWPWQTWQKWVAVVEPRQYKSWHQLLGDILTDKPANLANSTKQELTTFETWVFIDISLSRWTPRSRTDFTMGGWPWYQCPGQVRIR